MTTTAEILLDIASCLIGPSYGTATGGSATTLVDAMSEEPDEYFNGGTLFFLTGANAGRTAVITSWDLPSHTFTFPAAPSAVQAGDEYAALDPRYPRSAMVGALNDALRELGPFDARNEALAVIKDQWEYSLPAGVAGVKRLQFSIETVAPFTQWGPAWHYWEERDGTLYLSPNHPWDEGSAMRIWYEAAHERVSADADVITPDVHPRRIAWLAAWYAARSRIARAETADPDTKKLAEEAKTLSFTLERQHPVYRRPKDPRWHDLP